MHKSIAELESGAEFIRKSPLDEGLLFMIVRRPEVDQREELSECILDENNGLLGDNWSVKPSSSMPDKSPHPLKQITIMNSRAIEVIAASRERWALAGDQFYADLNLGYENLPPGTRLKIGEAIIEVSEPPHRGCKKFAERFGQDAMRFVNSETGKALNLRGINCRVIKGGIVKAGDKIKKISV